MKGQLIRLNSSLSSTLATDFDDQSNLLKHEKLSEEKRDLILTILNSTATKREARSYLSKYRLLEENDIYKNKQKIIDHDSSSSNFPLVANKRYSKYIRKVFDEEPLPYAQSGDTGLIEDLSAKENPTISGTQGVDKSGRTDASNEIKLTQTIRACVLRIRGFDKWNDDRIKNLGNVLRKAMSLGASPVVVIDGDLSNGAKGQSEREVEKFIEAKLDNLTNTLGPYVPSRIVQGCFDLLEDGTLKTVIPEMICVPIFSGTIPIISPYVIKKGLLQKTCFQGVGLTREVVSCLQRKDTRDILSVEKAVFVDEAGGLPSVERCEGSHVLVNLLQEYNDIRNEIKQELPLSAEEKSKHLSNLEDIKGLLDTYPDITGILTTPAMATREEEKQVTKETNPIIYNILTDRPTISSSLPVSLYRTPQLNTTVVKHGMPIHIFLSTGPHNGLDLVQMDKDGTIDLEKLKFLIDDSFGRNLNLDHYLNRINGKVAGLIFTGGYEGGAIITWENTEARPVAYLDKFAVVKKLQGIPGIADIVFKAMLNSFRDELLWRSRKNNPVNKWYFERSVASYSIENTQWRLFYTGKDNLTIDNLKIYAKICSSIEPSFDI